MFNYIVTAMSVFNTVISCCPGSVAEDGLL